jgi:hypothetical protein
METSARDRTRLTGRSPGTRAAPARPHGPRADVRRPRRTHDAVGHPISHLVCVCMRSGCLHRPSGVQMHERCELARLDAIGPGVGIPTHRRCESGRSISRRRPAHAVQRTGGVNPDAPRVRGLVLVLAPDRAGGAGVAHRARLIHGAKREGMVDATEQAVDLDGRGITRNDADVTNRAASDTT